jgi:16S rRNA U516 pseudouridylate synthase RsuA-like enzyme
LKRAYPLLDITASSLVVSTSELISTYSNSVETSREFREKWGGTIIFNTDATKLENTLSPEVPKFDLCLFNHPHLGDATLQSSEKHHAQRHYVLLCHYFHSAKQFLNERGRIHVCLCGNQPDTWNLIKAAESNGLKLNTQETTVLPVEKWLFREEEDALVAATVEAHYPCPRKYRNGKLGSKHFLGKYGYRHRRTGGDLYGGNDNDMAVHQSVNFVFEINTSIIECQNDQESVMEGSETRCCICGVAFDSKDALHKHLITPALPDIMTGDFIHGREETQNQNGHKVKMAETETSVTPSSESQRAVYLPLENATIIAEARVEKRFDSKRIKWLCRQKDFALSKYIKSKKQCIEVIKSRRIYVNGAAATDSSRIILENDTISLIEATVQEDAIPASKECEGQKLQENLGVKVLEDRPLEKSVSSSRLVVAYKPVGIRVVGSFSPNTLEMITKNIFEKTSNSQKVACVPVSKLDTGCAGLCLLIVAKAIPEATISPALQVTYKFIVLVHGTVPDEWRGGIYIKLLKNGERKWKRQRTGTDILEKNEGKGADPHENIKEGIGISKSELDLEDSLLVTCIDTLTSADIGNKTKLSTLSIHSKHDSGRLCSVISFVLRKLGYPVVNDRFCKRELAALPRRMRNILKQKICIGCYSLDIEVDPMTSTIVDYPPHRRTQCSYWKDILDPLNYDSD